MATLTADLCLVLLIFGGIFASASANDNLQEKTAKFGDDVTLQCQSPRGENITLLEWIRPDLEKDGHVFFYRNNRSYEHYHHPSFSGRVQLRDPEMKNGNVSVILKNVNFDDTGTYQCHVAVNDIELICTINLKVVPPDPQEITAKSGADVTLQCQSPRGENITQLHWIRPDLKTDGYVFFFRDDRLYENHQHPSFRGRVQLKNQDMKDGDVSVILKNVTINDAGIHQCHVDVKSRGKGKRGTPEIINIINLKVEDSGHTAGNTEGHKDGRHKDGGDKDGNMRTHIGLVVGPVVGMVAGLVVAVIYNIKKKDAYLPPADEAGGKPADVTESNSHFQ